MHYLVYNIQKSDIRNIISRGDHEWVFWKPSWMRFRPPQTPLRFMMYSCFYFIPVFDNKNYAIVYIKKNNEIIHRTCAVPAFFRWPFMRKNDIQLSAIWTDERYRGKGLAQQGVAYSLDRFLTEDNTCWYITKYNNEASIALCNKIGFRYIGKAVRTAPMGIKAFGQFVMIDETENAAQTH